MPGGGGLAARAVGGAALRDLGGLGAAGDLGEPHGRAGGPDRWRSARLDRRQGHQGCCGEAAAVRRGLGVDASDGAAARVVRAAVRVQTVVAPESWLLALARLVGRRACAIGAEGLPGRAPLRAGARVPGKLLRYALDEEQPRLALPGSDISLFKRERGQHGGRLQRDGHPTRPGGGELHLRLVPGPSLGPLVVHRALHRRPYRKVCPPVAAGVQQQDVHIVDLLDAACGLLLEEYELVQHGLAGPPVVAPVRLLVAVVNGG
mmetsp:Transcript_133019/g.384716  ORF Transcript_133019/g.384716 Transcript_133019/m.384716 type:complete len:262 (-) Transcript_133019:383-1168(-)